MRILMTVCLGCVAFCMSATGQAPASDLERTIESTLFTSQLWEGVADKQWRRSGDAVAVAMTKAIANKQLDDN